VWVELELELELELRLEFEVAVINARSETNCVGKTNTNEELCEVYRRI
jgi:hypothetical protein